MEQSYKEKYEQALAKAKEQYNYPCMRSCMGILEEIFPELKESEDEKVRKELINFLCELGKLGKNTNFDRWNKADCANWIAWLGKQKDKDTIIKELGEYKARYIQETIGYVNIVENDGSYVEQKPVEWTKEDDDYYDTIVTKLKVIGDDSGLTLDQIDFLDKYRPQQKPIDQQMYWTEEEIEPIISDYLCGREHYGGMIGRLCHLKPKQKQTEWGENDKAFLDDILCKLEHDLVLNKDEKDWLKSLRPQNHWKPTDEQMGCLSDAIEHYNSLGYPAPKLKELLDDLKELKGEV